MSVSAIEFQNVYFAYGARPILQDVSFSLRQGQFSAVMGGSGSGKTTLLRLISGQLKADSGKILIDGRDISAFSDKELKQHRQRMGFLFQHGALFTDLSVFDNIAFPMRELTDLPEQVIRDLVILKLNAVGLRGVEQLMPSELSGGMARRVALARTIALDPNLILFDEPFTGLDPISLGVIADLVRRSNQALKSTSVMVTHDIEKSLEIVDYVVFLVQGKVVFAGSPEQICESDSEWVRQFIGGKPNGPVPFRYPTAVDLKQDLIGNCSLNAA